MAPDSAYILPETEVRGCVQLIMSDQPEAMCYQPQTSDDRRILQNRPENSLYLHAILMLWIYQCKHYNSIPVSDSKYG